MPRPEFHARAGAIFRSAIQSAARSYRRSYLMRARANSRAKPGRAVFWAGAGSKDKTSVRPTPKSIPANPEEKRRTLFPGLMNRHRLAFFTWILLIPELPRSIVVDIL